MALNRLVNGEMAMKNPAGLRPNNPERIVPRDGAVEQEWWLRNNARGRERADPPFTYYNHSSMKGNSFQAGAIEKDHSRRVFKELAKQGHSFSEANLQAMKHDREIRKVMQKKYWEVMMGPSGPPGPTKSFLRNQDPLPKESLADIAAAATKGSDVAAPAPRATDLGSCVSASRANGSMVGSMVGSRVSAAALSRVTASQAAMAPPAMGDLAYGARSEVMDALGSQVGRSQVGVDGEPTVSQLSKSDFYAWRPRMLR